MGRLAQVRPPLPRPSMRRSRKTVRPAGRTTRRRRRFAPRRAKEIDSKGLPPMEELVKRIPPAAREALDELFRAKFTGVKRVPAKALKS